MLERKANVHFCCKCGKGMAYKEKSMIYLFHVEEEIKTLITRNGRKQYYTKNVPKSDRAYNLCEDCKKKYSVMLDEFLKPMVNKEPVEEEKQ